MSEVGGKREVRGLLPRVQGQPGAEDLDLRQTLLKFIGDFASGDLATHRDHLEVVRGLVRAAHGKEPPQGGAVKDSRAESAFGT